jgi:hypothetical protein
LLMGKVGELFLKKSLENINEKGILMVLLEM